MKPRPPVLLFAAALAAGGAGLCFYSSPSATTPPASTPTTRRPASAVASSDETAADKQAFLSRHIDAVLATIPPESEDATEAAVRERQISALVAWIIAHDLSAGLAALDEQSPDHSALIEERLLQHGVLHAPASTVAAILRARGPHQTQRLDYFFADWANHDPDAALAASQKLPDDPLRQGARLSIAGEIVRTRPAQALELARQLPASPARDDLIVRAAAEWACNPAGDAEAAETEAADWTRELANPALRERLVGAIATGLGETSPLVALDFATQSLPSGRALDTTLAGITARWAQTDPQATARWIERLPEDSLRNNLVETLVTLWSLRDPDAHAP